jgi:hypothetical protein
MYGTILVAAGCDNDEYEQERESAHWASRESGTGRGVPPKMAPENVHLQHMPGLK